MIFQRDPLQYWSGLVDRILPSTKLAESIHKAVQISVDENGKGRLRSNSDFHAFEITGLDISGEPFTATVEAKSLVNSSGGEAESVELTYNVDEATIAACSGKSNYVLEAEDDSLFVFPLDSEDDDFVTHGKIPKGTLLSLLTSAIPFLSTEFATPHLMGVLFRGKYVYATDMAHGARFKWDGLNFPEDTDINFIPEAVVHVLKSGGDDKTLIEVVSNSQWIGFYVGPLRIFTRRWSLAGEYKTESTDTELQLGSQHTGKLTLNTASLSRGLSNVTWFSEERLVVLEASRSKITLSSFSRGRKSAKTVIEGSCNLATPRTFLLDIEHLQSFVATGFENIDLRVGSPTETIYSKMGNVEYMAIPADLEDAE